MEYLFIIAASFLGGLIGAFFGSRRITDTPVPVEKTVRNVFTGVKNAVKREEQKPSDGDLIKSWLYPDPREVQ